MIGTDKNNEVYVNNKNGKRYLKLGTVINATNAQDGSLMVLYRLESHEGKVFVREALEFEEKFTSLKDYEGDSQKLVTLADACSDLIYGGERGWENVDFKEFVMSCRNAIAFGIKAKKILKAFDSVIDSPFFKNSYTEEEDEDEEYPPVLGHCTSIAVRAEKLDEGVFYDVDADKDDSEEDGEKPSEW